MKLNGKSKPLQFIIVAYKYRAVDHSGMNDSYLINEPQLFDYIGGDIFKREDGSHYAYDLSGQLSYISPINDDPPSYVGIYFISGEYIFGFKALFYYDVDYEDDDLRSALIALLKFIKQFPLPDIANIKKCNVEISYIRLFKNAIWKMENLPIVWSSYIGMFFPSLQSKVRVYSELNNAYPWPKSWLISEDK